MVKAIFYLFATLIHKLLFALLEIKVHILIHAALYPLCIIVASVFQVPDAAMVLSKCPKALSKCPKERQSPPENKLKCNVPGG